MTMLQIQYFNFSPDKREFEDSENENENDYNVRNTNWS